MTWPAKDMVLTYISPSGERLMLFRPWAVWITGMGFWLLLSILFVCLFVSFCFLTDG